MRPKAAKALSVSVAALAMIAAAPGSLRFKTVSTPVKQCMKCLYGIQPDEQFHKTSIGFMCVPCHEKVTANVVESKLEAPAG